MENGQMTSKIGGLLKDPRSKGAWVKWAGLVVIAALIIFNIGAILGFVTNVVRLALLLAGVIAAWLVVSSKSSSSWWSSSRPLSAG
jgi:hypothetical protein